MLAQRSTTMDTCALRAPRRRKRERERERGIKTESKRERERKEELVPFVRAPCHTLELIKCV